MNVPSVPPDALAIVILQQLLKADDYDSIEAVKAAAQDYLRSLNACPLDFSHQPHDHCDGTPSSTRQHDADPDNLPKPADLRRLRYQPHWSVREMDAIDELSRLKDLEPVAIVRQALRHYQLAHADLKNPALAVNTVNPVNPVPAPETFEAHGHTWTRHTPGDPCPVPPDTLVHVLLRAELSDPVFCDPKGSKWSWAANIDDRTDEIIGWRYATPQPSTPDK